MSLLVTLSTVEKKNIFSIYDFVCKNASRYHSVPGVWKKSQGQKNRLFFDRHLLLLQSVNPLLSTDVATFI